MNAKQRMAAIHARELRYAKDSLINAVNRQLQSYESQGINAEITPQIQTLLNVQTYRQRDIQKMNRLIANPDKLRDYILAFNESTGEVVSGEQAIERYNRWAVSKIRKPAKETEIVKDNFVTAVEEQFVDDTAYRQFVDQLDSFLRGDFSEVSELQWGGLKTQHDRDFISQRNNNNVKAVQSALDRVIEQRGLNHVIRAINSKPDLMDKLTAAAVSGYKEKAGAAVSEILEIFNPNGSAFDMGSMQDTYESQYEHDVEE